MKIYLATGNLNKKREISQVLPDFEVVIPKEMGIDFDPEETGTDFYQNSMIKALDLWHKARSLEKTPPLVMADDSGICVDALDGRPGIYSARYCPELCHSDEDSPERPKTAFCTKTGRAVATTPARWYC